VSFPLCQLVYKVTKGIKSPFYYNTISISLVTNNVVNYYLSQDTTDHIVSYDTVRRMDIQGLSKRFVR